MDLGVHDGLLQFLVLLSLDVFILSFNVFLLVCSCVLRDFLFLYSYVLRDFLFFYSCVLRDFLHCILGQTASSDELSGVWAFFFLLCFLFICYTQYVCKSEIVA